MPKTPKRFVETARELEASEAPEDFDKAFERVASKPAHER
jgi:hypothetical protein